MSETSVREGIFNAIRTVLDREVDGESGSPGDPSDTNFVAVKDYLDLAAEQLAAGDKSLAAGTLIGAAIFAIAQSERLTKDVLKLSEHHPGVNEDV